MMAQLREIKQRKKFTFRKAISITCDAQTELLKVLKPEMKEYQAGSSKAIFKLNGAEYPGYPQLWAHLKILYSSLHYQKTMKGNHLL